MQFAIEAADINADGHLDLFLPGQNDFSPVPKVGRFDGALSGRWLGDGAGNFSPVPASRSGLAIPTPVRAILPLDLNADHNPEWVITREQDSLLLFKHVGNRLC